MRQQASCSKSLSLSGRGRAEGLGQIYEPQAGGNKRMDWSLFGRILQHCSAGSENEASPPPYDAPYTLRAATLRIQFNQTWFTLRIRSSYVGHWLLSCPCRPPPSPARSANCIGWLSAAMEIKKWSWLWFLFGFRKSQKSSRQAVFMYVHVQRRFTHRD